MSDEHTLTSSEVLPGDDVLADDHNSLRYDVQRIADGDLHAAEADHAASATHADSAATVDTGGVGTNSLADGSVTTPKIADENVTNAKIPDGEIQDEKLAFPHAIVYAYGSYGSYTADWHNDTVTRDYTTISLESGTYIIVQNWHSTALYRCSDTSTSYNTFYLDGQSVYGGAARTQSKIKTVSSTTTIALYYTIHVDNDPNCDNHQTIYWWNYWIFKLPGSVV